LVIVQFKNQLENEKADGLASAFGAHDEKQPAANELSTDYLDVLMAETKDSPASHNRIKAERVLYPT